MASMFGHFLHTFSACTYKTINCNCFLYSLLGSFMNQGKKTELPLKTSKRNPLQPLLLSTVISNLGLYLIAYCNGPINEVWFKAPSNMFSFQNFMRKTKNKTKNSKINLKNDIFSPLVGISIRQKYKWHHSYFPSSVWAVLKILVNKTIRNWFPSLPFCESFSTQDFEEKTCINSF